MIDFEPGKYYRRKHLRAVLEKEECVIKDSEEAIKKLVIEIIGSDDLFYARISKKERVEIDPRPPAKTRWSKFKFWGTHHEVRDETRKWK